MKSYSSKKYTQRYSPMYNRPSKSSEKATGKVLEYSIQRLEDKFEESCIKLRCMNELIEFILTDYRQAVQDRLRQEVRHALKSRLLESKLLRESLCLRTCKLAEQLANLEHRLWLAKQDVLIASRDWSSARDIIHMKWSHSLIPSRRL